MELTKRVLAKSVQPFLIIKPQIDRQTKILLLCSKDNLRLIRLTKKQFYPPWQVMEDPSQKKSAWRRLGYIYRKRKEMSRFSWVSAHFPPSVSKVKTLLHIFEISARYVWSKGSAILIYPCLDYFDIFHILEKMLF